MIKGDHQCQRGFQKVMEIGFVFASNNIKLIPFSIVKDPCGSETVSNNVKLIPFSIVKDGLRGSSKSRSKMELDLGLKSWTNRVVMGGSLKIDIRLCVGHSLEILKMSGN